MTGGILQPRPYQIEAVRAVEAAHARGVRRPAVVLPTGAGKTVVFADLIKRRHERPWGRGGRRSLVLAHRTELIEQAAAKIHDVAPSLRVGIVKAERNETFRVDVVVASVQTLRNEARRRMIADVGLIVIDEAHHAPADSYLRVLGHYGAWGDDGPIGQDEPAVAVGFTATMTRGDEKALGDVWQEVVYVRSILEMVHAGYLVRPRGVRVRVDDLDLSAVKRNRGDYSEGDLGRALTESMAPEAIAKALREHCPEDPGLIFAPTVDAARIIASAVEAEGFTVGLVWGAMTPDARRAVLDDFKASRIQWLVNCMVLTEGTDLPRAKVVVIARPTTSAGLYVQMAGRVLRPYPGKAEALILDIVGATQVHSLHSPLSLFGEEAAALDPESEQDERDDVELVDDGEILAAAGLGIPGRELYASGPLVSEEVDLFHRSASAWLRTYGGIWFIPVGERLIALVPGETIGTWDVVSMHAQRVGTGAWITRDVNELSYAMAWAEADVTAAEKMNALRESSWRAARPNPAMLTYARRLGLGPLLKPKMTKGEVSELINVAGASARIDPYVPAYARGRS